MSLENPYNIQIKEFSMGKDYAFYITGGVAHIGAVATAYYNNHKIVVDAIQLPQHKEGELAKECAISAARNLQCTVIVSMGIHIDHATKEQITEIVHYVRKIMKEKIESINSRQ